MDAGTIQDIFAAFGPVRCRRMFGGTGVYSEGLMFALEADGVLYLKADSETEDDFRAEGCGPFVYEANGRTVTLSYWRVPDALLDDPEAVAPWARKARMAARRAKTSKASRGGRRKNSPAQRKVY